MTQSLTIRLDTSAFEGEIQWLLEQLSELPLEASKRFVHRFHSLPEFFRIDHDAGTASGAGDIRVVLQPSDGFLELVAALRAGDFDAV